MTVDKTQSRIMTEQEFNQSPLKNIMSYQDYFMRALRSDSAFNFAKLNSNLDLNQSYIDLRNRTLTAHNKKSEELIEKYQELEAIYKAMLNEQSAINNSLQRKYNVNNNNDLLTAMGDNNSLYDQGLYAKSAKSVNEAYSNFIAALQTANYHTHRVV